jgi:hypothetical protein
MQIFFNFLPLEKMGCMAYSVAWGIQENTLILISEPLPQNFTCLALIAHLLLPPNHTLMQILCDSHVATHCTKTLPFQKLHIF